MLAIRARSAGSRGTCDSGGVDQRLCMRKDLVLAAVAQKGSALKYAAEESEAILDSMGHCH